MTRFLAVAFATAVVACAFGTARAGHSSGFDFLVGAYERPVFGLPMPLVHGSVLAFSGPNGERPTGVFSGQGVVAGIPNTFSGKVSCLRVEGNRAVAGGVVTRSEAPNVPVGSGVLIQVTDNGFPGAGRDTNINFVGYGGSDPEMTTCPFINEPGFDEIVLTRGDFAVHDG